MSTVLKIGADFYILASSLSSRRATRSLASGDSFAVFDLAGDILESPLEALGFFHRDTRHLSRFELKVAGEFPHYLNSYSSDDGAQLRVNLTNPDLRQNREVVELSRNSLQIERGWVLSGRRLVHRLTLRNYALSPVELKLDFAFGADFADVFEVRGVTRRTRGDLLGPQADGDRVRLQYGGLDSVLRATEIVFDPAPSEIDAKNASFVLRLAPEEHRVFEAEVSALPDGEAPNVPVPGPRGFDHVLAARRAEMEDLGARSARLSAGDESVDLLIDNSFRELAMLSTRSDSGYLIMAGIPWFATLFGRDSLIASLATLWLSPGLTAGTLRTLAAIQGSRIDEKSDEQPGKIVHEVRMGEMARTGEVPFARYYGSVDSTPLFLLLLGLYVQRSGDLKLAEELWPNVERALEWVERYGDRDGDGFVEYVRLTPRGLANQGWKDSFDAISHADGTLARPPIALCEVQGYVYFAYGAIAEVAARLGHQSLSARLKEKAAALRAAFIRDFWLDDERTVALALDGDKKPCRVMSSNAAHCLACGLLDRQRASALAERLTLDDMFSGWGLRTLSAKERRYNPMSYHNGSVWPHDNAIAAWGLALASHPAAVRNVARAMVDASAWFDGSLPELFCGFPREKRLGPVPYPVACHPQAWSASGIFLVLQAMLGLSIDGVKRRLTFNQPSLPESLNWLRLEQIPVGGGSVSLLVRRAPLGSSAEVEILSKDPSVRVIIRK